MRCSVYFALFFLVFIFLVPNLLAKVINAEDEYRLFTPLYHRNIDMDKWTRRARKALCKIRNKYDHFVEYEAGRRGLNPDTITAIIIMESMGGHLAISKKGAKGLMQLMDGTAKEMGVKNPYDPADNIMGGTKYFKQLLDWAYSLSDEENPYGRDPLDIALAAYNLGPERTKDYLSLGFDPRKFFFVKIIKMVRAKIVQKK